MAMMKLVLSGHIDEVVETVEAKIRTFKCPAKVRSARWALLFRCVLCASEGAALECSRNSALSSISGLIRTATGKPMRNVFF